MSYASDLVAWTYDALGRATTEKRTISGITKSTGYAYNLDGSMATLTYPSGRTVTYTYNAAGRALSAIDATNNINYAKSATYAPQGALAGVLNGYTTSFAGIVTSNTYNKRLQPTVLSANAPSQTLLSLTYNFGLGVNDNGNVQAITNNLDGVQANRPNGSVAFTYDPLNRLASAHTLATDCTVVANSLTRNWGQNFTYDAWGNLYSIAVERCSVPTLSAAVDAATNRLTGNGYAYDGAGNMINDGGHAYTYDAEGRIVTAAGVTYTYDGDGRRVKKSSGKLYWTGMGTDPLDESDLSGTVNEEFVFFNGKRIARLDLPSGAVHYYFSDHLGSASVVTDATGSTIQDESDYYPFGGERAIVTSDPNPYKFTGKERDGESGLDYFGARYYASMAGRFVSADPVFGSKKLLTMPQDLNLYAYTVDNPLVHVDPDGRSWREAWNDFKQALADLTTKATIGVGFGAKGHVGPAKVTAELAVKANVTSHQGQLSLSYGVDAGVNVGKGDARIGESVTTDKKVLTLDTNNGSVTRQNEDSHEVTDTLGGNTTTGNHSADSNSIGYEEGEDVLAGGEVGLSDQGMDSLDKALTEVVDEFLPFTIPGTPFTLPIPPPSTDTVTTPTASSPPPPTSK